VLALFVANLNLASLKNLHSKGLSEIEPKVICVNVTSLTMASLSALPKAFLRSSVGLIIHATRLGMLTLRFSILVSCSCSMQSRGIRVRLNLISGEHASKRLAPFLRRTMETLVSLANVQYEVENIIIRVSDLI
jgi:hypothetical protein